MTDSHPELAAEQAHIDHAYLRLEEAREEALRLKNMVEVGKGGTNQARWEREVINESIANRLHQLELGERSLCFGRIDQFEEAGGGSYHIGRVAVASETQEPLIVDWRAPVAEAFYRATGGDPQGLVRRRHFTSRGRTVLGLEDEFFGEAARTSHITINGRELRGQGALVSALEESRTGRLNDIIGTIQSEQDEIIRAPLPGVLVAQGGPGTGKTVVALHRAAYLLYTHRFPLDGQGVLVIGPNRLFLGYIEQVLPSLGEAGVEMAVLADLVSGVRVTGRDELVAARIKGDLRMVNLVRKAVRDRQRALRSDLVVGLGVRKIRVTAARTESIISEARRRYRTHNAARKFVVASLFEVLAEAHPDRLPLETVKGQLEDNPLVKEALNWMWPLLSPAQLLHDLYGSRALIASAARKLSDDEQVALYRPWHEEMDASRVVWTVDDVPVLDEARERLGPQAKRKADDDFRTYGHLVVDEAQDLSPMQLRMLTRRSLNGSMTVVGDIAQSTGAWAHNSWDEILEHLPDRRPPRFAELTVGYRIPGPSMELAAKILTEAAPDLAPPVSVRSEGDHPVFVTAPSVEKLVSTVVETATAEAARPGIGNVAVICPQSAYEGVIEAFEDAGVRIGRAPRDGLDRQITVVPVDLVKGLEVDGAVVVEPAAILAEEPQGARSLYVAATRATKRLTMVNALPLPDLITS
ncbi:MAG: AAA family ATPase [Actinomycetia bacterium]|nr:AAA family ATPase [Actinomycetes bacterium]MCP5034274.1 AAA family ATPase [Actinomycetes bacterium]